MAKFLSAIILVYFGHGSLFSRGLHLPQNWITDEIRPTPVAQRDIVVQFNRDHLEHLASAFGKF